MADSHTDEIRENLETAMTAARMQTLCLIVEQFMIVLARQNYRLNDLLDALVQYSERRADWSRVTEHLTAASNAVVEARRELTGK